MLAAVVDVAVVPRAAVAEGNSETALRAGGSFASLVTFVDLAYWHSASFAPSGAADSVAMPPRIKVDFAHNGVLAVEAQLESASDGIVKPGQLETIHSAH